mgnify:CR=1 FL=1
MTAQPTDFSQLLNLFEMESLARQTLAPMARDYYISGAHDELTLRDNRQAFERLKLRYRVMVDVSQRSTATTVLDHQLSSPIMVAPTAFHRMASENGELDTARAAQSLGTVMTLSTLSNTPVEAVVEAAGQAPVWFQLYVYKDRGATQALVERAEAAGAKAVGVTGDAPLLGRRERDVRNGFRLPAGLEISNMTASGMGALPQESGESGLAAYFASLLDPALTWKDLDWLASITKLPVLVKGIVRADDAARAVRHGASGIVVSNHGGRQLDTSVATIDALPEVADAVRADVTVLLDGGIRRGTDVLKALALGAHGVLVGRPVLWGLATGGQAGVEHALGILNQELDLAMALAGTPTITDITRDLIFRH